MITGKCPKCGKSYDIDKDELDSHPPNTSLKAVCPNCKQWAEASNKIDYLYKSSKSIILLTCMGFLIPILIIIAAPLGLLYAFQRSQLLKKLSGNAVQPSGTEAMLSSDADKISFLRQHSLRFFVPVIILCLYVIIATIIILSSRPA